MREKQIEELAQVIAHSCIDLVESSCSEGKCVSCLATKLHKEGVTIQKWIPVTERLPEHGELVMCNMTFDEIRVFRWDDEFTIWANDSITHWMPLPSTEGLNEK